MAATIIQFPAVRKAIRKLQPDAQKAERLYKQGVEHYANGNPKSAEKAFKRATAADPQHTGTWCELGVLAYERGDAAGARNLWLSALSTDPTHAASLYNLAVTYLDTGRRDDALTGAALLMASLQSNPDNANSHWNLAFALDALGRHDDAQPHWLAYLKHSDSAQPGVRDLQKKARNRLKGCVR